MKSLRRISSAFVCFVCFVVALHAQPTPTPSTASLTVNRTTGAITGPVIPSLFASGNSLLTISGAAAAYQPLDAELTAISGLSANGFIARTSASTAAARTLTGTAGQITVTNGDGVSGNPTIALPATITQATTFSSSILGSGATAPTNTTSGSNQFTAGIATNGPAFIGGVTTIIGPFQDITSGLAQAIIAATGQANTAGNGGTLTFNGTFTGTSQTSFAGIRGQKENGTDANTAGAMTFWTRPAGGAMTLRATFSSVGDLSLTGALTVSQSTTLGSGGTEITGAGYLRVLSGFARTDTTLRNIAAFTTNEAAGSTFKLLVSVTGNATATARRFDLATSNEGVSNTGILGLQASGGDVQIASSTGATTVLGSFRSTSATAGIGYGTGAGGTVTQLTSKATGATLSTVTGTITTAADALAAGTVVSFVFTNTAIAATDALVINHVSGGTVGAYSITYTAAAGSATIVIRNNTAGSLSEALTLRFAVLKSVNI